jgi:hypothetical protein
MHMQCAETAESYECAVQTLVQLPAPNFKLFVYLLRFVRELADLEIAHARSRTPGAVCFLSKERMAAVFADALGQVPRGVMPAQPLAVHGLRRFVGLFLDSARLDDEVGDMPECSRHDPTVVFVPTESSLAA